MLEYFVHLDKDDRPSDLVLAIAEVPDDLSRKRIDIADLPKNWLAPAAPPELAEVGEEFVRRAAHCVLLVPPVLPPDEHNCLLNPAHPEFKRIVLLAPEPMALRSTNVWQTRSPTATATATLIIAQPHAVIGSGVAANR